MHGRLKVKTTAEQQEAKRKEREKKLKLYNAATQRTFEKRKNEEYDEEALKVTGELLSANPDVYTFWNFRREVFLDFKEKKSKDELQKCMESELYFLESCLRVNPKSYGTWHHRGWVLNTIPNPDWGRELQLCNKFLEYDERNFHCWDYRRFVVKQSQVSPEDEFEFTTGKISSNFSNFSSWHYRSKLLPVLHPDADNPVGIKEDILLQEYELVQNAFFTDPNDQSARFYHRWLLGRGVKPLEVRVLHVSRHLNRIMVLLTNAVKMGKDCEVILQVNGAAQTCQWTTPSQYGYSQLWMCDASTLLLDGDQTQTFQLQVLGSSDPARECKLEPDQLEAVWSSSHSVGSRFRSEFSAATTTILSQELESCQQLHELEPDNKWTLLTVVSLMRALDPLAHEKETLEYVDKLIQFDAGRVNYYRDLRSKFVIENTLERLDANTKLLNLSDKDLTSVSHHDHMLLMNSIDLSKNNLTQVNDTYLWPFVRSLNLDENNLTSCTDLVSLTQLENLSLRNNSIFTIDDLQCLTSCRKLKILHLHGNPLCSLPDFGEKIVVALPHVQQIIHLETS